MRIAVACRSLAALLWLGGVLLNAISAAPPVPERSPVVPDESLKYFQTDADLKIELVAAEPEVVDPIAIRFDDAGRMWVVEMRDYPLGPPAGDKPLSKIKILEDKNGDGRFETATVFAEHLLFPTGLQPWNGGVIVTMSGKVAFLKDTNGDNRADVNETWYTGFAEENSQLRANHPRLMGDGWVYVANGLRGGTIVDARKPDAKPISISGRDFRFHPVTGEYEAISGAGQFGMTFDSDGNRFVCTNRNPLVHVVIEERFAKKNPLYALPAVVQDVAASGEKSRVFPLTRAWTTSNLHAGQFTAACGVKIFLGDALGESYRGSAFTCEPTGNLIHREVLKNDGVSFTSKSPYEDREFLASTDEWFRPVNTETGPDGAMYVVDMYRAVIEHPQFVPDELKNRPDQRWGDDRGRIYRIVKVGLRRPKREDRRPTNKSESAEPSPMSNQLANLEKQIADEKGRSAWLKLIEKVEVPQVAFPFLLAAAPLNENEIPIFGKIFLKQIDDSWMNRATMIAVGDRADILLQSIAPHTGLLQFIEAKYSSERLAKFAELVKLALANKQDDRAFSTVVRALAEIDQERRGPVIELDAVPAGLEFENLKPTTPSAPKSLPQNPPSDRKQVTQAAPFVEQHAHIARLGLIALHQTLAKQGTTLNKRAQGMPLAESLVVLNEIVKTERAVLANLQLGETRRAEAIDLLTFDEASAPAIEKAAFEDTSQTLKLRAIAALAKIGSPESWRKLLSLFPRETPGVRRAIMDGVLANRDRTVALLDEIEAKRVKVGELDRLQVDRLLKHGDAAIKARSQQLLAAAIPADRVKVLADYQTSLTLKGDAQRGREVFAKNCAACHKIGDVGVNVAPDISDSRVKQPAQYLTDILQPNRAIDNNYISYVVVTNDGRSLTGILATETAGSITLRQAENKTVSLLRTEIEEIRSTGVSLMPEGLEKNIPQQAMADLISFIKNWRYLDGKTPFEQK